MNQNLVPKWTKIEHFTFRSFALYLILYFLFYSGSFEYSRFEILRDVSIPFQKTIIGLTSLVNNLFIHKQFPGYHNNADHYFTFIGELTLLIIAVVAALIWTVADKGKSFPSFRKYIYVLARYNLCYNLIYYGISKIDGIQFGLVPSSLIPTIGSKNAYGLFWTFMSVSKSYAFFGGLLETIAGVLLLFRRTSRLGSLIAIPVIINVLMLNLGYDVPKKLELLHLILCGILILIPDLKKLFQIIILNQTASLSPSLPPLIENKKYYWVQWLVKFSIIGYFLFTMLKDESDVYNSVYHSPYQKIIGIYDVNGFYFNQQLKQPLYTDSVGWKKIAVDPYGLQIQFMNDSVAYFGLYVDTLNRTFALNTWRDTAFKATLHYTENKSGELVFVGTFKTDSVHFTSNKIDMYNLPLLKRYGKIKWLWEGNNN